LKKPLTNPIGNYKLEVIEMQFFYQKQQ